MKITIQIEVNEAGELMLLSHKLSKVIGLPIESALLERLTDKIKDGLAKVPRKEFDNMIKVIKRK